MIKLTCLNTKPELGITAGEVYEAFHITAHGENCFTVVIYNDVEKWISCDIEHFEPEFARGTRGSSLP